MSGATLSCSALSPQTLLTIGRHTHCVRAAAVTRPGQLGHASEGAARLGRSARREEVFGGRSVDARG